MRKLVHLHTDAPVVRISRLCEGSLLIEGSPVPTLIRSAREALHLTQTEAAAVIGRTLRAWQDYESGKRRMDAVLWHCWIYWATNRKAPAWPT